MKVLYEGAPASEDEPGGPGKFRGPTENLNELENSQFLRFTFILFSNSVTGAVPVINEIAIPVDLSIPEIED